MARPRIDEDLPVLIAMAESWVNSGRKNSVRSLAEKFGEVLPPDAATGDGDMGSTLAAVARAVLDEPAVASVDVGASFRRIALVIAKTSGSSLSAIAMTIAMSLAQSAAGRPSIPVRDFVLALEVALDLARKRSGANFGDKTVLDGLKAIVDHARTAETTDDLSARTRVAIRDCISTFRARPIKIGRARLSSAAGVGVDDPGMVALGRVVEAITS